MYYIWSLLCSLVLFFLIQVSEYRKNERQYQLYTISNIGTFVIMYIIATIVFYLMHDIDNSVLFNTRKVDVDLSYNVDPNMLKKVTENIHTSFDPFSTNLSTDKN